MSTTDPRRPKQSARSRNADDEAGFVTIPVALISTLTDAELKTYAASKSFDPTDEASQQRIAARAGKSDRALRDACQGLLVKGAMTRSRGQGHSYHYDFPPIPDDWEPGNFAGPPNSPLAITNEEETEQEPGKVVSTDLGSSSSSDSRVCVPTRNRAPWKLHPRRSLFYTHRDTRDLVEFFEEHVLARDLAEKGKTRKVSIDRRRRWICSANDLLDHHPVEELEQVVSWLFDHCLGDLPFLVENEYTGHVQPSLRRVTRLAQILDHYPQLVAKMSEGAPPEPVQVEEIPVSRSRPKGYYDHGEGFEREDQVSVLVELFRKTKNKRHPPSDFDLFGWRKTFRIMLEHHQIPYDDIVTVVTALGNKRLLLDFARYSSPYDLIRRRREVVGTPGEWVNILGWVKLALLREQSRPKPAARQHHWDDDDMHYYRPHWDDDDDAHYYRYHDPDRDDDAGQSVNMAENVEERRRLYEARAARRSAEAW